MRRTTFSLAVLLALAGAAGAADKPLVLDLWPGKPPGEVPADEEKFTGKPGSRNLTNVRRPTITVYRPAPDKNTGAAVVIAPGGGYNVLAWDHEGEAVAAWLNSLGVTGVLLKYRVPQPRTPPPSGRCRTPSAPSAWCAATRGSGASTRSASACSASRPAAT